MNENKLLNSIRLENILSYSTGMETLTLNPLNVLIGTNAAGKSNLIEIISSDNRKVMEFAGAKYGSGKVMFFGDKLHLAIDKNSSIDDVRKSIENSGVEILEFNKVQPGLEDLFLQELTGESE